MGGQTFCKKSMKISGSVDHRISVVSTQLCHCALKAVIDDAYRDEHGCIPVKLEL